MFWPYLHMAQLAAINALGAIPWLATPFSALFGMSPRKNITEYHSPPMLFNRGGLLPRAHNIYLGYLAIYTPPQPISWCGQYLPGTDKPRLLAAESPLHLAATTTQDHLGAPLHTLPYPVLGALAYERTAKPGSKSALAQFISFFFNPSEY